tara:strand:+ start:646 stop:1194 length:549 start_codon:yes stop_codon:yes gene_type:complete
MCFVDLYRRPYTIDDIFDHREINLILNKSKNMLKKSHTVGSDNPTVRKSKSTFLAIDTDTDRLTSKIAHMVGLQDRICELVQVVRYDPGDYYKPHQDTCCFETCRGKSDVDKRIKTVIVYLNDDFQGGETCFPNLDMCIEPKRGRALVFNTYDMLNRCTRKALHEGRPVRDGTKYICTFWFR